MARPKLYNSNAEKMKAHRQRNLAKSRGKKVVTRSSFDPNRVQGQWEKRNDAVRLEGSESKVEPNQFLYLCKDDTNYYVIKRSNYEEPMVSIFSTEADARDIWSSAVTHKIDNSYWHGIHYYMPEARSILMSLKDNPTVSPSFSRKYALLFALDASAEYGFDGYKKESPATKTHLDSKLRKRTRALSFLGNKDLPNHTSEIMRDVRGAMSKILSRNLSEKVFMEYSYMYAAVFAKAALKMPDIFPQFLVLAKNITTEANSMSRVNLRSATNTSGQVVRSKNHPYIPIDKLPKILSFAMKTSTHLYDFMILSLTSGLRPEEMDRLAYFKTSYLNKDGTLNYKHKDPAAGVTSKPLISKTDSKIDSSTLVNPLLSIVGRVVLKYGSPRLHPEDFFASPKSNLNSFRAKDPDLSQYYERTMRTTAGHMIAFCEKAEKGRTTLSTVQNRLAHSDRTMAIEVYARVLPSDSQSPEEYFKLTGMTKGGFDIGKGSVLWDLWLLRNYIQTYTEFYKRTNDDIGLRRMWDQILREAKEYQKITGDPSSSAYVEKY